MMSGHTPVGAGDTPLSDADSCRNTVCYSQLSLTSLLYNAVSLILLFCVSGRTALGRFAHDPVTILWYGHERT